MKIGNKNFVLALVFGVMLVPSVTTFVYGTFPINNTRSLDNNAIDLGNPFYVEHYQSVVEKPETTNKSLNISFEGEGVLNGTLAINAEGNTTETFRNNDIVHLQGTAKFATDSGGIALYNFEAIGKYNPDSTFESRGAAIFNNDATGELSPLSNMVAIYQDRVDSNGNGIFLMWEWK
jgi:hypothetical protein